MGSNELQWNMNEMNEKKWNEWKWNETLWNGNEIKLDDELKKKEMKRIVMNWNEIN